MIKVMIHEIEFDQEGDVLLCSFPITKSESVVVRLERRKHGYIGTVRGGMQKKLNVFQNSKMDTFRLLIQQSAVLRGAMAMQGYSFMVDSTPYRQEVSENV